MLINRLLSAEGAQADEGLWAAIKKFFTELLYGNSDIQYENFSFGNQIVTYRMIIIAIALGLIIASGVMIYKRRVLGRFVRALEEKGATSAADAKMIGELGLGKTKMIVHSLKRGTLKRMIGCVQKDEHSEKMLELMEKTESSKKSSKKQKKPIITDYIPHPESDRYYLPQDEKKRKAMVALFAEKGSGIGGFILTIVFCIVAAALLFAMVPWFLSLLDKSL